MTYILKINLQSEELRNFATEHDLLFATASQLNRAAVEEVEFDLVLQAV